MNKITGYKFVLGVSKDTLHVTFGCFLEGTKNFFLRGGFFGSDGQIDDGNIGGRDLYFVVINIFERRM